MLWIRSSAEHSVIVSLVVHLFTQQPLVLTLIDPITCLNPTSPTVPLARGRAALTQCCGGVGVGGGGLPWTFSSLKSVASGILTCHVIMWHSVQLFGPVLESSVVCSCLSQADVIGQSFCEMLHPTDRSDLEGSCQSCKPGDKRGMFVVRMRTSMAPALRSEARMEYKVSGARVG